MQNKCWQLVIFTVRVQQTVIAHETAVIPASLQTLSLCIATKSTRQQSHDWQICDFS